MKQAKWFLLLHVILGIYAGSSVCSKLAAQQPFLSAAFIVLYGLMLDRMSLSMKNHWLDDQGRGYIFFPVEEVMQMLHCKSEKATKLLAELDSKKGIGLIERVRQGQGKPSIIYIKNFAGKELG